MKLWNVVNRALSICASRRADGHMSEKELDELEALAELLEEEQVDTVADLREVCW